MNDRFKFRVWHEEYKRMVDVYKFGLDMGVCEWVWHSNIYPTEDGEPILNDWGATCERQEIITRSKLINCELMQCTGLRDKNGKLIYEGDILKSGIHCYQVVWHEGKFVLNKGCKNYPIGGCDLMEIIGNIHENPELLEAI